MRHLLKTPLLALSGGLLLGATLFSGCSRKRPSDPLAVAAALPTPTVRPTSKPTARPTPLPTHKPAAKGRALFGVKTRRKAFALTFDDGPDPTYTPQVLKILKAKNAPATFFMVGKMVRAHGPTARQVQAVGFPIGAHSWSHPMKTKISVAEIERTDAMLQTTLHLKPTLFRPPYGILNNGLAREASSRGQDVILWTSTANDWNKKYSSEQLKGNVLARVTPGGIALMHDGGGDRSKTVAMLPGLIDAIRKRGYQLVTVPQLLAMGPPQKAHIGGRVPAKLHNKARLQHAAKKHGQTPAAIASAKAKAAAPVKKP